MTEIQQFKKYRCRIKFRPTYHGRKLREGLSCANGHVVDLAAMYIQDECDYHEGEWVMHRPHLKYIIEGRLRWISSGDVEVLGELSYD